MPRQTSWSLTGATTAENYQAVLRSLAYFNGAANADRSDRTVNVEVEDASGNVVSSDIVVFYETNQRTIDDAIIQKLIADSNVATPTDAGDGLFVLINEEGTGDKPDPDKYRDGPNTRGNCWKSIVKIRSWKARRLTRVRSRSRC